MIPTWHARAECRNADPDQFYPGKGEHTVVKAARRICARCPVTAECLAYALDNDERFGVWGGKSERERRRLRRCPGRPRVA